MQKSQRNGRSIALGRILAVASGAMLLQTGGCVIDEALLSDILNLTLEALLGVIVV